MNKTAVLNQLQHGKMVIESHLAWSSNYTFLVNIGDDGERAIYKPQRGERPLWDFDKGTLYKRERAAFLISEALNWNIVPPTVIRDGKHGIGSVQSFIPHDPDDHYFTFEHEKLLHKQLQKIALFDLLINNADRKGGHILLQSPICKSKEKRLWAIDHGICFHTTYKLRTIIWQFAGDTISMQQQKQLAALQQNNIIAQQLDELLSEDEQAALQIRLAQILQDKQFWHPGPGRHYPWPPI